MHTVKAGIDYLSYLAVRQSSQFKPISLLFFNLSSSLVHITHGLMPLTHKQHTDTRTFSMLSVMEKPLVSQCCYLISRSCRKMKGVWFDSSEMQFTVMYGCCCSCCDSANAPRTTSATSFNKAEPFHSGQVHLTLLYLWLGEYAKNANPAFE